jgi:Ca-activated chloride channel family protein
MNKKIALLIAAIMFILPLACLIAQDKGEEESAKLTYARDSRAIESRIVFKRETFVRGEQVIPISKQMLAGFEPDYVEFYLDGVLVHLDSEPPFEATIDTGEKTAKRSFIAIATKETKIFTATSAMENQGEAISEKAIADSFEILITSPIDGNYVIGRTPITVEPEFTDDARLVSVQIYVDGTLVTTLTEAPWEYVYNFGRGFNGRTVRVVAFDDYGRRAEDSIETPPLEASTFYVQSRVVTLDVTATDSAGRFLGGLTKDDFKVYDNGEEQEVRFFSTEERPLHVAVLIDTSGSMIGGKIRRSIFAAQQFISQLKEADHASVYTFGPDARLISEWTNDFEALIDKVGRINAIRDALTPLNDALYQSMESFKDKPGRKAIIVISDGADTASGTTPDMVNNAAKRANVRIYPIAIQGIGSGGRGMSDDPSTWLMRGLADVTGGAAFFPYSSSEFLRVFTTITNELRSSYTIGYNAPKADSNDWRKVKVEIEGGGEARTKEGYYPDEY